HDIRNRATRGALAQNTLKPAPCVLGDWAVPSRVKCRAVQLQDVPEEYLGLDRRLCAPRGGQMLAAHQIRIADGKWLVQMRLPSLRSLLSLLRLQARILHWTEDVVRPTGLMRRSRR